ncbi:MAG: SDR family NAD(P)-dependent oxidoreductase [Anaerolineae bacterium]|nr:SDR family NAD(P)-dependent oxidoreductase [Anaerolineae bacterium]
MADALIWGASGGIGQALVRTLKEQGWRVLAAARETSRIPGEADFTYYFDAALPHTINETQLLVAQDSPGLDLVIYAAGDLRPDLLKSASVDDWAAVMHANLSGAFLVASKSLYLLNDGGHMMVMGAYVDHVVLPKMAAYAVAKAGLETMIAVLRKENRKHKFTVVRPGAVDTPFWEKAPFKKPADAKSPEAVAQAIVAHYRTGENIDLNL